MPNWEYAILTRMSAGLDTKWHVNRVFKHAETELPTEITEARFTKYNEQFDKLHAAKVFPILPAVLNSLGADGWELIDDMNTGMTGGEGLVFKRPTAGGAKKAAARPKKKSRR
jgi:hypothetical protein